LTELTTHLEGRLTQAIGQNTTSVEEKLQKIQTEIKGWSLEVNKKIETMLEK
jgi:hypothetical protein